MNWVRVEPRLCDQSHCKNDAFTLSAKLPTIFGNCLPYFVLSYKSAYTGTVYIRAANSIDFYSSSSSISSSTYFKNSKFKFEF